MGRVLRRDSWSWARLVRALRGRESPGKGPPCAVPDLLCHCPFKVLPSLTPQLSWVPGLSESCPGL